MPLSPDRREKRMIGKMPRAQSSSSHCQSLVSHSTVTEQRFLHGVFAYRAPCSDDFDRRDAGVGLARLHAHVVGRARSFPQGDFPLAASLFQTFESFIHRDLVNS